MNTIEKNGKADKKAAYVNNNPVNKANSQPIPGAAKVNDENKEEQPEPKTEQVKAEAPKAETVTKGEQAQTGATAVKEEPKAEVKPEPVKPALNLEEVLKLVTELNRRKIQRDKLLETIGNLEAFEIELKEDADETDGNHYQGCVLTIEDDQRRKFTTKNPVIIWTVAQQVNSLCVNKLAEIEAGIIIPA
ncbi:MAG: hypothetical protein ABIN91_15195 [Mucilaginibacter sp.]|uniref:hypothetical protein n=1 Tax=Mucilaginibacter sp. TaxID=1882438 RepID=UPI003263110A